MNVHFPPVPDLISLFPLLDGRACTNSRVLVIHLWNSPVEWVSTTRIAASFALSPHHQHHALPAALTQLSRPVARGQTEVEVADSVGGCWVHGLSHALPPRLLRRLRGLGARGVTRGYKDGLQPESLADGKGLGARAQSYSMNESNQETPT
jgi:hypothetical protein